HRLLRISGARGGAPQLLGRCEAPRAPGRPAHIHGGTACEPVVVQRHAAAQADRSVEPDFAAGAEEDRILDAGTLLRVVMRKQLHPDLFGPYEDVDLGALARRTAAGDRGRESVDVNVPLVIGAALAHLRLEDIRAADEPGDERIRRLADDVRRRTDLPQTAFVK